MSNKQIKALSMAMVGATVAAVATMFVPAAILESFTGSTGISELVPAAAAPLGDTARALMAFSAGAFTLALLAFLLSFQSNARREMVSQPAFAQSDEPEPSMSLSDRLAGIFRLKMPWAKNDDDITDLSDLPKLRNGDTHPDAPPRRPLSAHQDLPALELAQTDRVMAEAEAEAEADTSSPEPEAAPAPSPSFALDDVQPTLAEMVAQLEAAVAERQKQLADLEIVAAHLAAGSLPPAAALPEVNFAADPGAAEPARAERPALEAVPSSPVQDEDMDVALTAALATLHRMNVTSR